MSRKKGKQPTKLNNRFLVADRWSLAAAFEHLRPVRTIHQ
jgi:hypothetical protein